MATTWAGPVLLAAITAAFLWWSVRHLAFFSRSPDEGVYLMWARLLGDGFRLYRDMPSDQPPLLMLLVRAAFDRFGETVVVARTAVLPTNTLCLVAAALVSRELLGWRGGLAAALVLVSSPLYFFLARAVMGSLPAVSLATLSLALVVLRLRCRRQLHAAMLLAASGLCFGLALLVKPLVLPVMAPIALVGLAGTGRWHSEWAGACARRRRLDSLADALLWSAALAVPMVLLASRFSPAEVFGRALGAALAARSAFPLDPASNAERLVNWLAQGHLGIAALGVFGIGHGLARPPRAGNRALVWRAVALWAAVDLVALLVQAPLWEHHFVLLTVPVAVAAGPGLVDCVGLVAASVRPLLRRAWLGRPKSVSGRGPADDGWLAFACSTLLATAVSLPGQVKLLAASTQVADDGALRAIEILRNYTKPDDFIVTDSLMIAFRAGLRVPPAVSCFSYKWNMAGYLGAADLAEATMAYHPSAVLTWDQRLSRWWNKGYVRWVTDNGWRLAVNLEERQERWLYVPQPVSPTHRQVVGARFSGGAVLDGYRIESSILKPGSAIPLVLFWHRAAPVDGDYVVCVHLVDPTTNRVVRTADGRPGYGSRPSARWQQGEEVIDGRLMAAPSDLPPGRYVVRVGLEDASRGSAAVPVVDFGRGIAVRGPGTACDSPVPPGESVNSTEVQITTLEVLPG